MTPILLEQDVSARRTAYPRCMIPSSWRDLRPPPVDIAVAGVFVLVGQMVTWGQFDEPSAFSGPRWANAVLSLLLMGALAWRRRAPLAAMSWAVAIFFLPQAIVPHDMTFLAGAVPLIVLTASAGYHCSRRHAVMAAVISLMGLVAITLGHPWLRAPDYVAYNVVFLLAPWLAARGLREREDRASALNDTLASERAGRDAALWEVVASERARIARELHDIVAHSVSVMVIQIGAARTQLPPGTVASEASLLAAEDVGRQALADLRRLLGVMRSDDAAGDAPPTGPLPPQPGLSQLDSLVAHTSAAGVSVEVQLEGALSALPAGVDLTAYRIVQEALTNTLKHSGATTVTIRVTRTASSLVLDIADDGTRTAPSDGSGHGIIGINERVSLFGGTAQAGPAPGGGWQVHAELPIPDPSPQHNHAVASPAS